MSASKLNKTDIFNPIGGTAPNTLLQLAPGSFHIRKNGIEFKTASAIPAWTEMTVELQASSSGKKVNCTGVIVACNGNRHSGYVVSMLFTGLTRQAQTRLNSLASPSPA